jgi:hypothetical protein
MSGPPQERQGRAPPGPGTRRGASSRWYRPPACGERRAAPPIAPRAPDAQPEKRRFRLLSRAFADAFPPPLPPFPYKVDTSPPSLGTDWTRLMPPADRGARTRKVALAQSLGIQLKYSEPPEAAIPLHRWRLYELESGTCVPLPLKRIVLRHKSRSPSRGAPTCRCPLLQPQPPARGGGLSVRHTGRSAGSLCLDSPISLSGGAPPPSYCSPYRVSYGSLNYRAVRVYPPIRL